MFKMGIERHHRFPLQDTPWIPAVVALIVVAWALATMPVADAALLTFAVSAGLILLRWPWLIWPAFAVALPVSSGVTLGPATLTELLLLMAASLWFADGVRRSELRVCLTALLLPLAIFGLALAISTFGARDLDEAAREVVKWLEFAAVLLLLPIMLPAKNAPWMVAAIILAGMTQAVLGLYQFAYGIGPDWFLILDRYMRASGSFRQPNPYAGYLGMILPVAVSLTLSGWYRVIANRDRRGVAWLWTGYYSLGMVVIGAALLASWSRGGWLGAAVAAFLVIALRVRRGAVLVGVAILVVAVAILWASTDSASEARNMVSVSQELPPSLNLSELLTQEVTDENYSVIERLAHWRAALRMWDSSPWVGDGPGNYAVAYPEVRLALWEEPLGHAHNVYLNMLAESGILGLASFLLFWIMAIAWIWRGLRKSLQAGAGSLLQWWRAAVAIGILGVFGHITVHSIFDNLFVQGLYLQVALWLAVLAAARFSQSQPAPYESEVDDCPSHM